MWFCTGSGLDSEPFPSPTCHKTATNSEHRIDSQPHDTPNPASDAESQAAPLDRATDGATEARPVESTAADQTRALDRAALERLTQAWDSLQPAVRSAILRMIDAELQTPDRLDSVSLRQTP